MASNDSIKRAIIEATEIITAARRTPGALSFPREHMSRQIGRFRIDNVYVQNDWRELLVLLADVVIIRAEHRFDMRAIEYVGFCERFEEVEDGAQVPEYELDIETGLFHKLERCEECGAVKFDQPYKTVETTRSPPRHFHRVHDSEGV